MKNNQPVDSLSLKPPSVKSIDETHKMAYLKKMEVYKKELGEI